MDASSNVRQILCIGDMCADIFASPMTRLPEPGELALTNEIAVHPGGNALNTAIALRRLGEPAGIAGSVGDDAIGGLLLDQLRSLRLNTRGVRQVPDGQTATTIILRAEGEDRRFIHALGVAADFTGEHVPADVLPENGIVLVGGYLKLGAWNDESLATLLGQARARDCRTVLNVCIARDSGVDVSRAVRLLKHVDVFVPNEDEAQMLTGQTDLADQAQNLREAGAPTVIITLGQKGLYADDGSRTIEMGIFDVPLVDPSGCGDCFTAGMLAGLSRDWDLVRVLEFASAVGALGATALGCTNGVPSFADAEQFVKDSDLKISIRPSS